MKERLEDTRRAAPQETRDDADVPFGHFVRKLRLKADIEHLGNQSENV